MRRRDKTFYRREEKVRVFLEVLPSYSPLRKGVDGEVDRPGGRIREEREEETGGTRFVEETVDLCEFCDGRRAP